MARSSHVTKDSSAAIAAGVGDSSASAKKMKENDAGMTGVAEKLNFR